MVGFMRNLFVFSILLICINFNYVCGKSKLNHLNEDNWDLMLTGEWMVEFYAPWCPACKALQSTWEDYSSWSQELGISVGQVDVTTSPGLSGRFMVTALPTIFHVFNGEFRQYRGPRDKDAFISYIEDKTWKQTEAIPSWKAPSSLQMSVVAYFFKLSQLLRSVHTKLMEEYGLPTWGSYLIFAVGTIFLGALLGLILVCIIDFIYPPKVSVLPNEESSRNTGDSGEESDDDWADEDEKSEENQEKKDKSNVAAGDNEITKLSDKESNSEEENVEADDSSKEEKSGAGDAEDDNKESIDQTVRHRGKKNVRKAE